MNDAFRFASYNPELQQQISAFQEKPDRTLVLPIVRGIINHYLPKDRKIAEDANMDYPMGDLGLDSLTLMEITLDVQDAFQTTFTDEELRGYTSFSQITELIDQRIRTLSEGA